MDTSHNKNVLMGILAYIGPLVIVSYFAAKDDPFVKFHIKQGLVLFAAEIVIWVLGIFLWQLLMLLNLIDLIIVVFAIIGIINVTQGKESKLPLIGDLSRYFSI